MAQNESNALGFADPKDKPSLIVLGGPARCGKSTLAQRMEINDRFFGFSEDALLTHIFTTRIKSNQSGAANHLLVYLERSRYKNRRIGLSTRPIDRMAKERVAKLIQIANKTNTVSLGDLVFSTFQKAANEKNKAIAFFADVHAEFWGTEILEKYQHSVLLVVLREPVSAIAAALYWQSYPSRIKHSKRHFWYRLLLWCASVGVAQNLSKKYPNRVFFEWVWRNKNRDRSYIWFHSRDLLNSNDSWNFDFDTKKKKFRSPEGHFESMLSQSEVDLIQSFTHVFSVNVVDKKPEIKLNIQTRIGRKIFEAIVMWIAKNPRKRHAILRSFLFPVTCLKGCIQRLKANLVNYRKR